MIFGSQRALMGHKGALSSLDTAVDAVKHRSMQSFWFFIVQLVTFHLSSFLLMWLCYDFIVAVVVSIVLLFFFIEFVRNFNDIYNSLYIKDEDATSNKLMQKEDKGASPPKYFGESDSDADSRKSRKSGNSS